MEEKIEILPVSLLDTNRSLVADLKRLARKLRLEFGWHYLLDLTWILSKLDDLNGKKVVDAGAGTGIMQWYLAQNGAEVVSVDRESRAHLPIRFRRHYRVTGLRPQDLSEEAQMVGRGQPDKINPFRRVALTIRDYSTTVSPIGRRGAVVIYNQDLKNLVDIPDNILDAVVAVSSLEHNSPQDLEKVVLELMRVLKPGAKLLATLAAGGDKDWFHLPSRGWCYSEASLRRIFGFPSNVHSNYDQYDQHFEALRNCTELRDHLASFYARSGDNGMPWGVWDPQYQPVGVCKIKTS
jgi:SAM-dependent methyltransferase